MLEEVSHMGIEEILVIILLVVIILVVAGYIRR
jgi:hypothetical protein